MAKLCDSPSLSEIFVIFALDFINNTQSMLLKQRNPFLRQFQNKEKIVIHHKLISHTFQFPVFHGLPGNMQHPAYLSALFMPEFDFCFQLIQSLLSLLVSVLAPSFLYSHSGPVHTHLGTYSENIFFFRFISVHT